MKDEFKNYLESVGITSKVVLERVEEILGLVVETKLMPQVDDIYVGEYLQSDGARVYDSLLLFKGDRIVQAVDFLERDVFRIEHTWGQLRSLEVEAQDYDFKKATVKSHLKVRAHALRDELLVDGEGTRENCDQLKYIMLKYWMPSMRV